MKRPGPEQMFLVTMLTDFFLLTVHASPWGTAAERISGTQAGSRAPGPWTPRHYFLPKPKSRSVWSPPPPQQQLDPRLKRLHRLYDGTSPPSHRALGTRCADASDTTTGRQDLLDPNKARGIYHCLSVQSLVYILPPPPRRTSPLLNLENLGTT